MAWALDRHDVGGTDKLVLIGIANHADRHGSNAYPSIETLARYASVKRRAVQRSIAVLVDLGLLSVEVNGAPDRRIPADRRPNLYTIRLDTGVAAETPRGVSTEADRGVVSDTTGRLPGHDGVADTTPKPSLTVREPSVNQHPRATSDLGHEADPLVLSAFDQWWSNYPRRLGKPTARKAWEKLTRHGDSYIDVMQIADGTKRWAEHWLAAQTEERFIPHPSTFLNRQQYNDDPPSLKARPGARVDDDRDGDEGKVSGW